MISLTFGEQVKIILSRKGMTIKDLAELIEERTGQKMSRQNLTQRLGRDNFQERDMRQIAEILGCPFQLSILSASEPYDHEEQAEFPSVPDFTIGDLLDLEKIRAEAGELPEEEEEQQSEKREREQQPENSEEAEDSTVGEINPYTGREYKTDSVRSHPKRIGYVEVYDRGEHKWTEMTEWAFLGYQERKKKLLGKNYVPPVYLD